MNIRDFFWFYIDIWAETNKSSDLATIDQCIDLWRAYHIKILNGPWMVGNPPDIWANAPDDIYEKIPNTPDGVPQLGDVIIWGTKYGKYGHIAICTEIANTREFTSFDQNDPIGEPCHFQPHTYAGVLGWLRPKNQEAITPPENGLQDKISDLETKVNSLNEQLAKAQLENNELRTTIENQERDNKDLIDQLLESRNQRDTAIREKKEVEGTIADLQKKNNELYQEVKIAEDEIKELREALSGYSNLKLNNFSTLELAKEVFRRIIYKRGG